MWQVRCQPFSSRWKCTENNRTMISARCHHLERVPVRHTSLPLPERSPRHHSMQSAQHSLLTHHDCSSSTNLWRASRLDPGSWAIGMQCGSVPAFLKKIRSAGTLCILIDFHCSRGLVLTMLHLHRSSDCTSAISTHSARRSDSSTHRSRTGFVLPYLESGSPLPTIL